MYWNHGSNNTLIMSINKFRVLYMNSYGAATGITKISTNIWMLVGSGKGKEENENKKCRTPSTAYLKQEECLHWCVQGDN